MFGNVTSMETLVTLAHDSWLPSVNREVSGTTTPSPHGPEGYCCSTLAELAPADAWSTVSISTAKNKMGKAVCGHVSFRLFVGRFPRVLLKVHLPSPCPFHRS